MGNTAIEQPIIRGIQAVGSVEIRYRYNGNGGKMILPKSIQLGSVPGGEIDTSDTVAVSGFRLDSEFLRANPQIASSFVIPILGGGGVALTNNNRTGTLSLSCTKVSTPNPADQSQPDSPSGEETAFGSMFTKQGAAIGVYSEDKNVYDMVFLAQVQQAQVGGDSEGATIDVNFMFCGMKTSMQFQGCTIASVDPIGLAGNDAVNYNVSINYLNWVVQYDAGAGFHPANGASSWFD